jgi:hypothetical protein
MPWLPTPGISPGLPHLIPLSLCQASDKGSVTRNHIALSRQTCLTREKGLCARAWGHICQVSGRKRGRRYTLHTSHALLSSCRKAEQMNSYDGGTALTWHTGSDPSTCRHNLSPLSAHRRCCSVRIYIFIDRSSIKTGERQSICAQRQMRMMVSIAAAPIHLTRDLTRPLIGAKATVPGNMPRLYARSW